MGFGGVDCDSSVAEIGGWPNSLVAPGEVGAGRLAVMRRTKRPATTRLSMVEGIREGLRYCRSQAWLWWSMLAVGVANLACYVPFLILQPLLVSQVFHAGAVALGIMYAASGAGGAIASAIAARLPTPRRRVGSSGRRGSAPAWRPSGSA